MQLITIAVSHYNERARWGLDHFAVPYLERRYMPVFHMGPVWWATRGRGGRSDRVSTPLSTPLLVTDDGERIHDSGAIVRWASDRYGDADTTLYPPALREEIEAFEARIHDRLGPHTRRIAYWYISGAQHWMHWMAERNVGRAQAVAFRLAWPGASRLVFRGLKVNETEARRSLDKVREQVAELDDTLRGRTFLFGDRFTAADLCLSCMLAPVLLPSPAEGYGAALPPFDELDPEPAGLARELRQSPTGQHALRMFATRRRPTS